MYPEENWPSAAPSTTNPASNPDRRGKPFTNRLNYGKAACGLTQDIPLYAQSSPVYSAWCSGHRGEGSMGVDRDQLPKGMKAVRRDIFLQTYTVSQGRAI
jgi:hypothetical protein